MAVQLTRLWRTHQASTLAPDADGSCMAVCASSAEWSDLSYASVDLAIRCPRTLCVRG